MIEKFGIDVTNVPTINAAMFNSDAIIQENKFHKTSEIKENYLNVECPLAIQAAIGGDIDIFKFLVDRGANILAVGHIGLSRKIKNSIISNIIGAAAFYGRVNLLHFILEKMNHSRKLDVNIKCIEKKAKALKQFSMTKDFSDFTPAHLTISSEFNSQDDSIEIIKILMKYKADFNTIDFNKNNILHLAARFNKLRIVKFILEELGSFKHMLNELNKEGQTPVAIAQTLNHNDILNYLENSVSSKTNIDDELLELIEENSNKNKKKKKGKKTKEEEFAGTNFTEFQEILKLPKPKPKEEQTNKNVNTTTATATASAGNIEEENEEYESNEDNAKSTSSKDKNKNTQFYERKSYYTGNTVSNTAGNYTSNYGDSKYRKNYNTGYKGGNNANYSNRYYEKDTDYDYNYNSYDKNYNYTNRRNKNYETTPTNEETIVNTAVPANTNNNIISINTSTEVKPSKTGIIGLSQKGTRKNRSKDKVSKAEKTNEDVTTANENITTHIEKSGGKEKEHPTQTKTFEEPSTSTLPTSKYEEKSNLEDKFKVESKIEEDNEEDYLGEENFITDENNEDKPDVDNLQEDEKEESVHSNYISNTREQNANTANKDINPIEASHPHKHHHHEHVNETHYVEIMV
jgi:hypothetical protein